MFLTQQDKQNEISLLPWGGLQKVSEQPLLTAACQYMKRLPPPISGKLGGGNLFR